MSTLRSMTRLRDEWRPPVRYIAAAWMAAGVAVVAVAVRVPFFDVPMISDEGGYSYVAQFSTDTYRLYRDIPFDRPPAIFLIYEMILGIFGPGLAALRLGAAVWNALSTLAIFAFSREVAGSHTGAAGAAVLFAVVSTSPSIEGFTANAELFAVLPLVVAAHLAWRQQWTWAGVVAGLATQIKPIGVSAVLLAGFWIVRQKAGWQAGLRLCAGYGLVGIAALFHIASIDWTGFWAHQQQKASTLSPSAPLFVTSVLETLPAWLGIAAVACIGLSRTNAATRHFGLAWVLSSFVGMAIGGHWAWHYWMQLIPALAWLTAPVWTTTRRMSASAIVAVTVGIVLFTGRELPQWLAAPNEVSWTVYHRPGYLVESDIAAYIKRATTPADTIQVAFWEAAIYSLSERRASVPHLYYYEYVPSRRAYDAVVQAISRRQPAMVIVVNDPPQAWATREMFVASLSAAGYEPQRVFGGIAVYARSSQPGGQRD